MSGGGSGYTHSGGRQQRKRPRDFDDDQYRRPRNSDSLDKLTRDLVNLADPGNVGAVEDIKYVARKIAIDYETPENQKGILDLFCGCIVQLSVKTCHYAAVVSLAGAQNKEFGDHIISMVVDLLRKAYEAQVWRDVKLLVRFLATLDRCFDPTASTTLSLLQEMLHGLEGREKRSQSTDHLCAIVMLTLPYLITSAKMSDTSARDAAPAILEQIQTYLSSKEEIIPARAQEALDLLHAQCKNAVLANWNINYLPTFIEAFGPDIPIASLQMPSITLPTLVSDDASFTPLVSIHPIFTAQAIASVPLATDLASSIFRDQVSDILNTMVSNRKDAARFLIDLESYLPSGIFVLRGTPLDKIPADGPTWKAEDIVVEGIFSELFTLPAPSHKPVYYHSVLTELCKLVPQAIAPTFGRAIRAIYSTLDTVEPELAYRFWDWFSHHLSNFGFNWKWQEWVPDLSLPALHPKRVFILQAIAKEAELSYNQRIKTTLPEEYHDLIADEAPGPDFPELRSDHAFHDETSALLNGLGEDGAEERVTDSLHAIAQKADTQNLDSSSVTLTILVKVILQLGHQSFSHALNTIERNLSLLQSRCDESAASRRTTVAAVMSFWSGRPFIASTLIQKLLNYRIISPISVVEHVLAQPPAAAAESVTWELLRDTIDKVNARVTQVRARLDRLLADTAEIVEDSERKNDDEEQLQRLQQTFVDVQSEQQEVLVFVTRHFLDQSEEDEWLTYWTQGLFRSILRHNKVYIEKLEDFKSDAKLAEFYNTL